MKEKGCYYAFVNVLSFSQFRYIYYYAIIVNEVRKILSPQTGNTCLESETQTECDMQVVSPTTSAVSSTLSIPSFNAVHSSTMHQYDIDLQAAVMDVELSCPAYTITMIRLFKIPNFDRGGGCGMY